METNGHTRDKINFRRITKVALGLGLGVGLGSWGQARGLASSCRCACADNEADGFGICHGNRHSITTPGLGAWQRDNMQELMLPARAKRIYTLLVCLL